jgi:secreted protein with Ig-like and vWFA domain
LNSVIALDISGSMSGPLQRTQKAKNPRNRLDLCKEAIKMFVSKLRPSDTFGLVLFNTAGHVLIPIQQREYFDLEKLFSTIN